MLLTASVGCPIVLGFCHSALHPCLLAAVSLGLFPVFLAEVVSSPFLLFFLGRCLGSCGGGTGLPLILLPDLTVLLQQQLGPSRLTCTCSEAKEEAGTRCGAISFFASSPRWAAGLPRQHWRGEMLPVSLWATLLAGRPTAMESRVGSARQGVES